VLHPKDTSCGVRVEHFADHGRIECRALKGSDVDWLDGELL